MIKDFESVDIISNGNKYVRQANILTIVDKFNFDILGSSSKFNFFERYLSSIGEYYERNAVFRQMNSKGFNNVLQGINLIDNSIVSIDKFDFDKIVYFSDTCACSCHTNSYQALKTAFLEFIERQSFIFRYLTKTFRYKIIIDDLLKSKIIPKELNYLDFYEISLIDSVHVVLSIGIYNGRFNISLGSGCDIISAIKKNINECMQIHNYYKFDNLELSDRYSFKKSRDYFEVFIEIDLDKLINAYKFLDDSKVFVLDGDLSLKVDCCNNKIIHELYEMYSINPVLFFLKNKKSFKVVKIVDFNWFPSLLPKSISEEKIKNIEKITGVKIDRKCNFIPFP